MSNKNFFGKWKYQQVDAIGNPIVAQTFNTRRRRNISYNDDKRTSSRLSMKNEISGSEFNLKYTPEIVRLSDGYKLQTGSCVLYQEPGDPIEAWFVYNIIYKELDRTIDVMVIRLVDWEFLEREYNFTFNAGDDKYNELIIFSEFDVIMADSWYQTIKVSSYDSYKSDIKKTKNIDDFIDKHRYVRYLFDVANRCLREINYDLFKEQCTREEGALENFKRLISSGHGKRLLNSDHGNINKRIKKTNNKKVEEVVVVGKKIPEVVDLTDIKDDPIVEEEQNVAITENENDLNVEEKIASSTGNGNDLRSKEKNVTKLEIEIEPKVKESVPSDFEHQQDKLSDYTEQLHENPQSDVVPESAQENTEENDVSPIENNSKTPVSTSAPSLNIFSDKENFEVKDKSKTKSLFISDNVINDSPSKEFVTDVSKIDTESTTPTLGPLLKKGSEIEMLAIEAEDKMNESDFLPNENVVKTIFPVHIDDFDKKVYIAPSSELVSKKRKRGKIVVNPDVINQVPSSEYSSSSTVNEPGAKKRKIQIITELSEYNQKLKLPTDNSTTPTPLTNEVQKVSNLESKEPSVESKEFNAKSKDSNAESKVANVLSKVSNLEKIECVFKLNAIPTEQQWEAPRANPEPNTNTPDVFTVFQTMLAKSNELLFREEAVEKIYTKLSSFVNKDVPETSAYIVSGKEGSGKLYTIEKITEYFSKTFDIPFRPVVMEYKESMQSGFFLLKAFIKEMLATLKKESNFFSVNRKPNFFVIIDDFDKFLKKYPDFLPLLLTCVKKIKCGFFFICIYNEKENERFIRADLRLTSYTYTQLEHIIKITLEREAKKFAFFTDVKTGALIFTLNEATRLDLERKKSGYVWYHAVFHEQSLKYLTDLAFKRENTLKTVFTYAFSAITLLQELYHNAHSGQNVFKNFYLPKTKRISSNKYNKVVKTPFNISVKHIEKTIDFLKVTEIKKSVQSLQTTSKFVLWVMIKLSDRGIKRHVPLSIFFQFLENSLIANINSPILKNVISVLTTNGKIEINVFNWEYLFAELEKTSLINIRRSANGKIVDISLRNKTAMEYMLIEFSDALKKY
ncbi:hypothetical protein HANVADRAFT_86620 [Hanseniaspora valbyensis NRRL Y-1626]|uniref:Uncharacterized protein n=1 Tax=Hanseniaspora valbyensis NRRL Y-1626 TaxID=766949 RepID=A0A1B7TBX2_9ASCO|nr:hypothetical protein HANVADRAFT_86620 [Hanseniaspora valbyensis NRRL Y-1626]